MNRMCMKNTMFIITLLIYSFINKGNYSQKKGDIIIGIDNKLDSTDSAIDSIIVEGFWIKHYLVKPKKGNIDNDFYTFFIPGNNIDSINLKGILLDYHSYLTEGNSLFLSWGSDARAFFYYYPSYHSKENWQMEHPLLNCKLKKVKGRNIKISFCRYKAYRKVVSSKLLKNQIMIFQTYYCKSDSTTIYLFYELLAKKCIELK